MKEEALRARSLPAPPTKKQERKALPLSAREVEIVRLLGLGLTNKEIAVRLCLSPETVKTYVARVLKKTSAKNRTEAVFKARAQLKERGPATVTALKVVKAKL
ncbi:MAG: response regulator transcription factor [Thermoleophilia bacterium]